MAKAAKNNKSQSVLEVEQSWVKSHVWMNTCACVIVLVVEVMMFLLTQQLDAFKVPESVYFFKYLLAPTVANGSCVAAQWFVYSGNVSMTMKKYVLSLGLAVMCFITYSVHEYYSIVGMAFVIPVVLTVVYGDLTLMWVTSAVCVCLELVSEFYIFWDPDKEYALSGVDQMVKFLISMVLQLCLIGMCRVILEFERRKLELSRKQEREQSRLKKEAYVDALTELPNRASLRKSFDDMLENRGGNTYHFVMSDIDRFKMVNDKLGHLEGDRVLKELGAIFLEKCPQGCAFRFGGDEFCMLFQNTDEEQIISICRQIQTAFRKVGTEQTRAIGMSLSFGIAKYDNASRPVWLIQEADNELYIAKKRRSCISIHGELIVSENR